MSFAIAQKLGILLTAGMEEEWWQVKGYVVIEKTMFFFNIAFHSAGRVLCIISDPVTANVFLKPIFQS